MVISRLEAGVSKAALRSQRQMVAILVTPALNGLSAGVQ